jgi:phosphatidylserine/phosphatidylglycerophosphate/cardiolipin synthase-like enzyme
MRLGNRFTLISDGREFFARMLSAIEASQHYVLLEFYLVESGAVVDQFIAALARAVARGVRVRALLDGFGARGLTGADRARLRAGGVILVFYNEPRWASFASIFLRDHRKLLTVDGTAAFTGGAGLTDVFSPDARPDSYWWDCMVEMHGPVLNDWHLLFASTWRRCRHQKLDIAPRRPAPLQPGESGRVMASAGLGRKDLGRSVVRRVRKANRRVWLATAYFWPSIRLRRALCRAARSGADVRLVVTGPHTDTPIVRSVGRLFFARLLANGVVIYEYQQRFMHCKLILCDDWASIGSSNLDRWGALWNLDANQEIESANFARQVETAFTQICQDSAVLRHTSDVAHPWSVYFWRQLARLVFAWSVRARRRLRR